MPDDPGSVTRWLGAARDRGETAARELCRSYFEILVRLACTRLRAAPRAVENEEDVALGAFDNFIAGAARGCYHQVAYRLGCVLWTVECNLESSRRVWTAEVTP